MDHTDPWIRLMQLSKTKKALNRLQRHKKLENAELYLINGVYNMNLHKIGAQQHEFHKRVRQEWEKFIGGHMKRRTNEEGFVQRRLHNLKIKMGILEEYDEGEGVVMHMMKNQTKSVPNVALSELGSSDNSVKDALSEQFGGSESGKFQIDGTEGGFSIGI
jgi:hypothetical protein